MSTYVNNYYKGQYGLKTRRKSLKILAKAYRTSSSQLLLVSENQKHKMIISSGFTLAVLGILIIMVELTEAASVRSSCPPGWFFYRSHCYAVSKIPAKWADSEYECVSYGHGAHLASIMDDSEASIIASHVSASQDSDGVWIGLHDPDQNGRWKWTDGSMFNYLAWKSGVPDNAKGKEFCVVLINGSKYKKWNDVGCGGLRNYVCKFKP
ncbi:regenerating islet-derived protein 4-like [Pseudophryne corroboree]|uniref:regenerating islet-derived protein 4-like n=1 Tax=Pseudophryne corroboree TaxID=495146 RepID=UPI003081E35B